MGCCTVEGTGRMFTRQANWYARKFRRKGLDSAQRAIVASLERSGLQGKSILEIGCGVGSLHLTLLQRGAASACGVEISSGMIEKAKELADELGFAKRVSYWQGDVVNANGEVGSADVVVMDKVICCYANPDLLLHTSAAKARRYYVISYPRNGLLAKIGFGGMELFGSLFRCSFHPFYHSPSAIEEMVHDAGFEEIDAATTPIWQVKMFERSRGSAGGN